MLIILRSEISNYKTKYSTHFVITGCVCPYFTKHKIDHVYCESIFWHQGMRFSWIIKPILYIIQESRFYFEETLNSFRDLPVLAKIERGWIVFPRNSFSIHTKRVESEGKFRKDSKKLFKKREGYESEIRWCEIRKRGGGRGQGSIPWNKLRIKGDTKAIIIFWSQDSRPFWYGTLKKMDLISLPVDILYKKSRTNMLKVFI